MGFLSKLFGKKDRKEEDEKESRREAEILEETESDGTEEDAPGLTPEEEAAAEAAETAFFEACPEIANEDEVAEAVRLNLEKEEREQATEVEKANEGEDKEKARTTTQNESKDEFEDESEDKQENELENEAETRVAEPEEDPAGKESFWGRLKSGLTKTRNALFAPVDNLLKSFVKVDEDLLEELEEILISADVGMEATEKILDELRDRIRDGRLKEKEQVMDALREIMTDMIGESEPLHLTTRPSVLLVIGVNGAGKTTSIGKMSKRLRLAGKKVVVAAADTFRAAAIDQLAVWCERAGVEMVRQNEGSDPAAVVFDAIAVAKKREADVLIIDTAGRLQNKKNLMNELAKIDRVIDRELPGADRETLLVLDATTGQNAVSQAKEFSQAAKITGITLNKLDGTAKGGIIISIKEELHIPVKFIGVGEKIDDMQEFDSKEFVSALFGE